MNLETQIILYLVLYVIYFCITFIWMRYTFKYNTLNKFAFRRSLEKDKIDFMHYIEMMMVILLLIGLITTIISQIQICFIRRNKNDKYK